MASSTSGPKVGLEDVPPGEAARIDNIAALTIAQLTNRYTGKPRVLRGVHPKDHGCVEATFTVSPTLDPKYRVGVFKKPGAQFRAAIRFSNASTLVTPDSPQEVGPDKKPVFGPEPDRKPLLTHGSRGMAVKLYDVGGERLAPGDGERTQDFLMINQPVFAFANVEDYEVVSALIAKDDANASLFFARARPVNPLTGAPNPPDVMKRALKSLAIVREVQSLSMTPPPPMPPFPSLPFPYQTPPLSPLDNTYFSAAPFLFGEGRVMKFSARPVKPMSGDLGDAISGENYLREALAKRMAEADGKDICFDFQVQVREQKDLGDLKTQMEDMCTLWEDEFVTVARITIPPQDVSSAERKEFCEKLFYTPWHGLADHQPLGGINRLRQKVYDTSAKERKSPVSPELPPVKPKGPPLGTASGQATPAGSLGGAKGSLGPRRKP